MRPCPRVSGSLTRPAALAAAALAAAAGLTACGETADRLLSVTTPSRLGAGQYVVPSNAGLLVASAAADFECAFGAYVVSSGLTAGELTDVSQTAARWSLDRRDVLPGDALYSTGTCQALGTYTPINTARFTADQAHAAITGWTDAQVANRQALLGRSALYAGFALVLLGEGYCSGTINVGPELTSAQVLDSAAARVRALAGYRRMLATAYPGRPVTAALVASAIAGNASAALAASATAATRTATCVRPASVSARRTS